MASPIIAAVRNLTLKESLTHTAQELAHKASIYGVVRASNTYMGQKCRCSARTFQRHVLTLEQAHILRKTVIKTLVKVRVGDRMETRLRNAINTYTFTIPWQKPSRSQVPIDKMASNLPHQDREKNAPLGEAGGNPREKTLSVRDELANQKRMLNWLYTPGSDQWHRTCEEIARLEALLAPGRDV